MNKKIKNILLLAISSLIIVSCNDMDNPPKDSFTDSTFWTSAEKAQYVVNMAYNQLYNAGMMWRDENLSDNMFEGRFNTDARMIRNGQATTSLGLFAGEWAERYGCIKTCNLFLEKIDLVPMNESERARMIAEIRYIRAATYLRLTQFYGDVPFFTKQITLSESKTIKRTNKDEVIAFIHQELEDVAEVLPTRDELAVTTRGRITKGAAAMLDTRTYLYDSNWAKVVERCEQLIYQQARWGTYSLHPSYVELFTQEHEYNNEIIMDCAYAPSVRLWGEMLDMAPLSVGGRVNATAPTRSLVDNYLTSNGFSIQDDPSYKSYQPYENRDPRLAATVIYHGYPWSDRVDDDTEDKIIYIKPGSAPDGENQDEYKGGNSNQTCTGYYVRKYYDAQHENDLKSSINIITMRYADVLLMYAEALNELNQLNATKWNETIRLIRSRAGFTVASALDFPTTANQTKLREMIRNERRSELALEGLRWFDIKRWKAGKIYLSGRVKGDNFDNGNTIQLDERVFDEQRDYLWSVPQSQLDLNANLKPNNSGYSN